jgi:hypothetical protein
MSQTVVTIDVGGTGANTAAGALISLGAAPAISFDQSNTAVVTANIANAQATTANTQANFARAQANAAYNAANNRVLKTGDTMTGNLNVAATLITQNVIPDANITYDLGTSTARFKDLWLSNSTIHLGEATISAESGNVSFGNATVQLSNVTSKLNVTNDLFVSGNVGIGTTSPTRRISIDGGSETATWTGYQQAGTEKFVVGLDANGSPSVYGTQNASMIFYTNNIERVRITNNGIVGIGTTETSSEGRLFIGGISANEGGQIVLQRATNNTFATHIDNYMDSFRIMGGNNTTSTVLNMVINHSTGNVGIGTSGSTAVAPTTRLHVGGTGLFTDTLSIGANTSTTRVTLTTNGDIQEFFAAEANPRWRIHRDLFGGGQAAIGFNDSVGTIAATGGAVGCPTTRTLGFATSNGTSLVERMRITSSGHLEPSANATYNLGSSTARWATVFTSDLDLSNGIGDWTIVEGEDDLFIYNNKRGKVYKFKLEEVEPSIATPKKN